MATMTKNGMTFDMTVAEIRELLGENSNLVAPIEPCAKVETVMHAIGEAIVQEPIKAHISRPNSAPATTPRMQELSCADCGKAFLKPVKRGRKPNRILCPECKSAPDMADNSSENSSDDAPTEQTESATATKKDAWKTKPAKKTQIDRILNGCKRDDGTVYLAGLHGRKTSPVHRQYLLDQIKNGLTGQEASDMWTEVKMMPIEK